MTSAGTPDSPGPSNESTPIADQVSQDLSAAPGDDNEEDDEAPETAKAYKVDVARALERTTYDGKGDEDPGPSDWQGFATDGVEKEES